MSKKTEKKRSTCRKGGSRKKKTEKYRRTRYRTEPMERFFKDKFETDMKRKGPEKRFIYEER